MNRHFLHGIITVIAAVAIALTMALPGYGSDSSPKTARRTTKSTAPSTRVSGAVRSVTMDDILLSNDMFRITENGLIYDHGGFSFAGTLNVNVTGMRGKRVICFVSPVVNGSSMADNYGECTAIYPFTPTSENFNKAIKVALPISWFGIDIFSNNTTLESLQLNVALYDLNGDKFISEALIDLDQSNMDFRREDIADNMLMQFLGGGVSGNVIHTCTACDGTGLCDNCYGEAYIDPSVCRKCASNPGVCRRCKGKGEEGMNVRTHSDDIIDNLIGW